MNAIADLPASVLPLVLSDVRYEIGGRRILDGVSLTLEADRRTMIVGANGAGKSVLLRVCHGLLAPTSGRVNWATAPRIRDGTQAMVFQRPVLLRRSALGNVAYGLGLAGMPRAVRHRHARAALRAVGLDALGARSARVLSGGEQQRLALARVWALTPQVLFLDEPTANLDPAATHEIERVIDAMHRAGTKIVMVTHNLGQARRLGDEVVFLHQGRVLEHTPADIFFKAPRSDEAVRFLEGELPW